MVWKLDRLGRNTRHVFEVVDALHEPGIGFRSLTEGITTEGPMGRSRLTIMAVFAQLERDTMIERRKAGLAAAVANGRKGGRRPKLDQAHAQAQAQAVRAAELRAKGNDGGRDREGPGMLTSDRVPIPRRSQRTGRKRSEDVAAKPAS